MDKRQKSKDFQANSIEQQNELNELNHDINSEENNGRISIRDRPKIKEK